MDLAELADKYLGPSGGQPLHSLGPYSRTLHGVLGHETQTTPLIATVFWQAFLASPLCAESLNQLGASPTAIIQGESYIVMHGWNWPRHDLIVFDPNFRAHSPVAQAVVMDAQNLSMGWEKFRFGRGLSDPFFQLLGAAALETSDAQPYGLIVAPRPEIIFTRSPSPGWSVVPLGVSGPAGSSASTAGVVVRNAAGKVGVTAALHAVGSAKQASVNQIVGTVVSVDVISDSCFIEVPSCPIPPIRGLAGVLNGITPRVMEQVTFDGIASHLTSTVVTGWSPDLPYVLPYSQVKVLTRADTNLGDSGAALVDSSDHIIGFSFYRTGFNVPIEYSAWIWAASVFAAHGLTAI